MNIIYHIDKVEIQAIDNNYYLTIQGFCFEKKQQNITFQLYINQEPYDASFIFNEREDVVTYYKNKSPNLNCGFHLHAKIPSSVDIEMISLKVNGSALSEILTITSEQLKQYFVENKFTHTLDSFRIIENQNECLGIVKGWFTSQHPEGIIVCKVEDKDGKELKHKLQFHFRADLYQSHTVDEQHAFCGYTCEFPVKYGEEYNISVSDGTETLSFRVQKQKEEHKVIPGQTKIRKTWFDHINPANYRKKAIAALNIHEQKYNAWFQEHEVSKEQLDQQRAVEFTYQPLISIIVPVFQTPDIYLHEMIQSVLQQSYSHFELCIADGGSEQRVKDIILEYARQDKRINYLFLDVNEGISGNTNQALSLATGDYIALFDHDDLLTPDCLYEIVSCLQNTKHDIVYTDEDKTDEEGLVFMDPHFKPDFNLDLLRSNNYITHFFVVKHEILQHVGGFRDEYNGSQDYDIILRCVEQANSIYHIPRILYHWRIHAASTAGNPESKLYCYKAGKKALQSHLERLRIEADVARVNLWGNYHVVYATGNQPLVSILISNTDQAFMLQHCISSLLEVNTYKNIEIIIVDYDSKEQKTLQLYEELKKVSLIKVIYSKQQTLAERYQEGMCSAKGSYMLLLHPDTQLITETAISEMLGHCLREDVGVVGAKLIHGDDSVQHAGMIVGFDGFAAYPFTGQSRDDLGYMALARINCDYSAVTSACMMVKKAVWDQVNGFSKELHEATGEVDFCLKVREAGFLIVYNGLSLWYHYEYQHSEQDDNGYNHDLSLFQEKWKQVFMKRDPYYNANFLLTGKPFTFTE